MAGDEFPPASAEVVSIAASAPASGLIGRSFKFACPLQASLRGRGACRRNVLRSFAPSNNPFFEKYRKIYPAIKGGGGWFTAGASELL